MEKRKDAVESTGLMEEGKGRMPRQKNAEVWDYIHALTRLYGVFDKGLLMDIWNSHNPEDPVEDDWLDRFLKALSPRQDHFSYTGDLVYSSFYMDQQMAEELHTDLQSISYYIPSANEMPYFVRGNFNEKSKQYKKMKSFVQKHFRSQRREVMALLMDMIQFGCGTQSVVDTLVNNGWMENKQIFADDAFASLYEDLLFHSRIWFCRGNKLIEWYQSAGSQ